MVALAAGGWLMLEALETQERRAHLLFPGAQTQADSIRA